MPGVPTGRGCDGCRQQKKKCDLAVYPCARCKRLNILCVGLGQRRYKFVHNDQGSTPAGKATNLTAKASVIKSGIHFNTAFNALSISRSPSNETTRLAGAFTDKIKPSLGIKYNLAWTYGDYLVHVPARLGANEALDTATDTFVSAFSMFSNSGTNTNPAVLEKYGLALTTLRTCLDDPVKARAPETLCAILFLWNSQQFIWSPHGQVTAHAEGLAQLIRLRGCAQKSQDPFESGLLLALRAVVLFDSLFNGRVEFSDQEWVEMFDNKAFELSVEGQAVKCMTRLPNLMRRSKAALLEDGPHQASIPGLQQELDTLREELEPSLSKLRERWYANWDNKDGKDLKTPLPPDLIHCHFLRAYSLGLTIAIFINETRLALCSDRPDIVSESHQFALEIVEMARIATQYRPVGAYVMTLCLVSAAMGAGDDSTRNAVQDMRLEYAADYRGVTNAEGFQDLQLICGREWARSLPQVRQGAP